MERVVIVVVTRALRLPLGDIFKEDLQKLVNEIGIEIRIAHYPPYCSKYCASRPLGG